MDAQNAVEPASTKPTSLRPSGSDADQHPTSGPNRTLDLDSVPFLPRDPKSANFQDSSVGQVDDGQDGNSDTETIVLPGKDGYSPSKVRKIKNEDAGVEEDHDASPPQRKPLTDHKHDRDVDRRDHDRDPSREPGDRPDKLSMPPLGNGAHEGKKKTLLDRPDLPHSKDASSGLSSAPASPPLQQRRQRSPASDYDSDHIRKTSSKASTTEKARDLDRVVPHKRKAPKVESEDEVESRKIRRQRMSGSGLSASRSNSNRDSRPNLSKLHTENSNSSNNHTAPRNRSISPVRVHRRSMSTQHSTQSGNGLGPKKKRVPAPLQSTEYHSDESSASASSHPRSSKIRQLATPATAESMISPAKMAPHKKHLDAHGQTFLARACAKGDYPLAKQRLQERPEDINHADYAGNTPLQIAALNGHEEIVKLLLDAGCNVDCVNNEKETPLMDAVENDHLEVVKLLLAAGVNPRKANAYGEEPIDKIDDDNEDAQEMRAVLKEARQRFGQRRRTSEEHHAQDHTDGVSSHGQESPRRSPGPSGYLDAGSRRAGTVRATKTSNHLLYMPMDDKTLRQAAARGDEETVMRILQVRESFDDPESMVNAAKAGHEMVLQLLLALGGANPDPKPVRGMDEEFSTPMLAAIGQNESLKVVKLLLAQNDFDPTRRFKGETYYEIARRRKGPNCEDEEAILKRAYDEYREKHRDAAMTKSTSRRDDPQKELTSNAHKRKASSPARESKKTNSGKSSSTGIKEKRRSDSFAQEDQMSPKRAVGRPKKDIPTIAVCDRETSPAAGSKQAAKARQTESEMAASSEGETASKPRRKLVSRKELNGDREKQQPRRTSLASNASSFKEPSSPQETRPDESSDKVPQKATEKLQERTKVLKRDESRDRLSVSGEHTGKRHRVSASPTRFGSSDKEGSDAPAKKRRLDMEGKETRRKPSVSPDGRSLKVVTSQAAPASTLASSIKASHKPRDEAEKKSASKLKRSDNDVTSKDSVKSAASDKSVHVKGEDTDVQMRDVDRSGDTAEVRTHPDKENDHGRPSPVGGTLQEAMKKAQERKREYEQEVKRKEEEKIRKRREEKERERRLKEEEENRQRLEEEKRQREEEEIRKRREEVERKAKEEDDRRKLQEEAERRQREEDERRQRIEEERKRRAEEERRRQEQEAKLIRAEEERKKRLEEEMAEKLRREEADKRKQVEDERRKREEAERLRREQVEREAAEEAARVKEQEDRRAREEAERKHREDMERRRAAREAERLAELHRIHMEQEKLIMEQERLRLSKLPPVLRWLDESPNPKMVEVARKFSLMQGVRYDCIRPESTGTADGREQWVLNTQVALLLGEKDLTLSRYTAWQHVPVSDLAKQVLWRHEGDRYTLTNPSLYDLGRQIEGYYEEDPEYMGYRHIEKLKSDAWTKFAALDMFFVKVTDLMFIVPTIPHLRSVPLAVEYRELPQHESQLRTWAPLQKWKSDPDSSRYQGFAPRTKYYLNGSLIREDLPGSSTTSRSPFPEKRVPRKGLQAVSPTDPDYYRLSREQGLAQLAGDATSPPLPNGLHSSPASVVFKNGLAENRSGSASPPSMYRALAVNGDVGQRPLSPSSANGATQARLLVNGVNGSPDSNNQ